MAEFGYRKLTVWKKADELAYQTYLQTKVFPKEEMFGMRSQIRRAALSVPTNIVEGYARQGKKELHRFVGIALGSLAEVKYLIDFSMRLKYLTVANSEKLESLAQETGRLLWKFYKSL